MTPSKKRAHEVQVDANDSVQKRSHTSSSSYTNSDGASSSTHAPQHASSSSNVSESQHVGKAVNVPSSLAVNSTSDGSITRRVHIYQDTIDRLTVIGSDSVRREVATIKEREWDAQLHRYVQEWASWDVITSLIRWSRVRDQLESLCRSYPNPQEWLDLRKPDILETTEAIQSVWHDKELLEQVMQLSDMDALQLIDLLDEMLVRRTYTNDHDASTIYFCRLLCGNRGLLPKSVEILHDDIATEEPSIASGGFAEVFRGRLKEEVVAIKALRITRTDSFEVRKNFCKEVSVWRHIAHPNVVSFRGVCVKPPYNMCLVSKWMANGTLVAYLRDNSHADKRMEMMVGIATGLQYLHAIGIVHGDLKGANILVDEQYRPCLSDFGLASINYETDNSDVAHTSFAQAPGTLRWIAPELFDPEAVGLLHSRPSREADVWALAMVMLEVFTGRLPYDHMKGDAQVMLAIIRGALPQRPNADETPDLTDDIWSIMTRCWVAWNERPTVDGVHSWLTTLRSAGRDTAVESLHSEQNIHPGGAVTSGVSLETGSPEERIEDAHRSVGTARPDMKSLLTNPNVDQDSEPVNLEHSSLSVLQHVAKAEAGCDDRAPCMDGTRVALLKDILEWAVEPSSPPIYWLNGMAGAGKTTIAETFALALQERRLLGASFFCSRSSPDRRDIKRILPSLAYCLAREVRGFHGPLVAVLKSDPNVTFRSLRQQFETLIVNPIAKVTVTAPSVIVVDALDEGDDSDSHNSTQQLLDVIMQFSKKFRARLKFFITSRPEPVIRDTFEDGDSELHSILRLQDIEKSVIQADIRRYIDQRLRRIRALVREYGDQWPPREVEILSRQAGTLFIYASTLCAYIEQYRADPVERLRTLAKSVYRPGPVLRKATAPIDDLYSHILEDAFSDLEDHEVSSRQRVLAAIVFVIDPLSVRDLAALLGMTSGRLRGVLTALHSVIQVPSDDDDTAVSWYHASFPDYLTDPTRSGGKPWATDRNRSHFFLTNQCLDVLNKELKFNVTHALDSHLSNDQQRDVIHVDGHLRYACLLWQGHMSRLIGPMDLPLDKVDTLFRIQFLYWLEVMSVTGSISFAQMVLKEVAYWSDSLQQLANDCMAFLQDYEKPIEKSAPHIYLSALPWAFISGSEIGRRFIQHFPNTIAAGYPAVKPSIRPIANVDESTNVLDGDISVKEDIHEKCAKSSDVHQAAAAFLPRHEGHIGWVNTVSFSSDGKYIASGANDRTVRLWDAATAKLLLPPFTGHTKDVLSVMFSPDGVFLASGSADATVRLWDVETGLQWSDPFHGHTDAVASVMFSPNGRHIASGSHDATVQLWNVETREVIFRKRYADGSKVLAVAVSPDGERIAVGSRDETVRVLDATTGSQLLEPFEGHTGAVNSVAFSPDSKRVVSGSVDDTVRLWDAVTGEQLLEPFHGHYASVQSVAFSPNGTTIVSGSSDDTVRFWDAETGRQLPSPFIWHTGSVYSVAFSPSGDSLVSCSTDRAIRLCSVGSISALPSNSTPTDVLPRITAATPFPYRVSPTLYADERFDFLKAHWIFGSDRELLFWVPPELQGRLLWPTPENTAILGEPNPIALDLRRFVHGLEWTKCYSHA